MAFPNVSDLVTTAIESRSKKIRDNVTKNNGLLAWLKKDGKIRTISGGTTILEEISFAENQNGGWYSGYDLLPTAAADVLTAAQFSLKQYAVPVVISGLEMLINSGKEALLDLLRARLDVAEATMANAIATGLYSDGTGAGGKIITGLGAAVTALPTTGVYGSIDRSVYPFWRNQYTGSLGAQTASTIQGNMNKLFVQCVRGADRPNLIVFDNTNYTAFLGSLQTLQRFSASKNAELGFSALDYMGADVILDGGIGGGAPAGAGYFINTKFLHFRPHKDRDMVVIGDSRRMATNQDAEVKILGWAGNLTCSGTEFQGFFQGY